MLYLVNYIFLIKVWEVWDLSQKKNLCFIRNSDYLYLLIISTSKYEFGIH